MERPKVNNDIQQIPDKGGDDEGEKAIHHTNTEDISADPQIPASTHPSIPANLFGASMCLLRDAD